MKKIKSLMLVLLLMLASFTTGVQYQRGDVDQDGNVDIADVTFLIDYLLNGTWPDEPVTPPDNHEWVDLGLPSGTLWATCNIGASSPEEYGDYFAWGETTPKDYYDWNTYMFTDIKTELDPEDDAATVNWGAGARMPSLEQIQELVSQCSWQWTQRNGVYGQQGTGPNGNIIFLPAAGFRWSDSLYYAGSDGDYWSRTLSPDYSDCACDLDFFTYSVYWGTNCSRDRGNSVRAVRVP